jgi:hypothetical protein
MDDAGNADQAPLGDDVLTQEKTAEARRWGIWRDLILHILQAASQRFVCAHLTHACFFSAFGLFEKDGQVNRDDLGQVRTRHTGTQRRILFARTSTLSCSDFPSSALASSFFVFFLIPDRSVGLASNRRQPD